LRRTHGGAIQVEPMLYEPFRRVPSFVAQEQMQAAEKRRIGIAAAAMIKDREIVALSAGTTTTQVGRSIHDRKGVTIVTNAINIAIELSHRLDLKIIMTGGFLNQNRFALSGASGIASVKEIFYDWAFISVDGIHPEHGFTCESPELGAVNRAMIQQSRQTVVVADYSKFGKVRKTLIAPIAKVDLIVTDNSAPRPFSGDSVKMVWV
jgi:DeoR family transcriptional regulator, aga operon transcriptional repressor